MCECFKKITDLVEKSLEGKNEVSVEWQNQTIFFNNKPHAPTVLKIDTEYRQRKVNGQPYRNKTKDSINVILKYCPFCGERIEE